MKTKEEPRSINDAMRSVPAGVLSADQKFWSSAFNDISDATTPINAMYLRMAEHPCFCIHTEQMCASCIARKKTNHFYPSIEE